MAIYGTHQDLYRLKQIFIKADLVQEYIECLAEECAIACLHGLLENAVSEWAPASPQMWSQMEEFKSFDDFGSISTLDWFILFPEIRFQYGEWGWEFQRGRMISEQDYLNARDILSRCSDSFTDFFQLKHGYKPTKEKISEIFNIDL